MFNLSSEVYLLIFYMFTFIVSLHVNQAHTIGFIWEQKRIIGKYHMGTSINRGGGFRGPESIKAPLWTEYGENNSSANY